MKESIENGDTKLKKDVGYDIFREEVFEKAGVTSDESKLVLEQLIIKRWNILDKGEKKVYEKLFIEAVQQKTVKYETTNSASEPELLQDLFDDVLSSFEFNHTIEYNGPTMEECNFNEGKLDEISFDTLMSSLDYFSW